MTSISSGMKLAASVGIPKPRLIIIPSLNSLATRSAIVCSSSRSFILRPLSHNNPVDIDAGSNDYLGTKTTEFHQFVHLDDSHLSRARHDGIKVTGGALVNTVAVAVGRRRPHQSEISLEGVLKDME